MYSNWLSKNYIPVDREELRDYVKARLKVREPRKFVPRETETPDNF